jgi:4-hydroxy-tetrahydrodipicolinate reductase
MTTKLDHINPPQPGKVYRVAQWATGRIGTVSMRALIESPQFDLVGVLIHSKAKEGKDAGELCGLGATGVLATRDMEKIIALKPDCVVGVPDRTAADIVCRFLEAGINVATSRVDYVDPAKMNQDLRSRVEAACRKGNSSIHATGSSPGFVSESLPLVLTSMSRTMDCLTIDEFADFPASCRDSQCVQVGFGRPMGVDFPKELVDEMSHGFIQSINVVATALGVTLDGFDIVSETAATRDAFDLPGGTPVSKGTVGAQRITISGLRNGRTFIRFRINWYITTNVEADWDLRASGWRLMIEGETPICVEITHPSMTPEKYSTAMAGQTGYRVVNSVPLICAASAGIRTSVELPVICPKMG